MQSASQQQQQRQDRSPSQLPSALFCNWIGFFAPSLPRSVKRDWVRHGGKVIDADRFAAKEQAIDYFFGDYHAATRDPLINRLLAIDLPIHDYRFISSSVLAHRLVDEAWYRFSTLELEPYRESAAAVVNNVQHVNLSFDTWDDSAYFEPAAQHDDDGTADKKIIGGDYDGADGIANDAEDFQKQQSRIALFEPNYAALAHDFDSRSPSSQSQLHDQSSSNQQDISAESSHIQEMECQFDTQHISRSRSISPTSLMDTTEATPSPPHFINVPPRKQVRFVESENDPASFLNSTSTSPQLLSTHTISTGDFFDILPRYLLAATLSAAEAMMEEISSSLESTDDEIDVDAAKVEDRRVKLRRGQLRSGMMHVRAGKDGFEAKKKVKRSS